MSKYPSFDYEYPHHCQYEGCREPAIATGWWLTSEGTYGTVLDLCQKHLDFILEHEGKEEIAKL